MNISKLNNWISLVANLGVLIGLFVLIVELNQNTRVAESTAYQGLINRIAELNQIEATDAEFAEILHRGIADASTLTPIETGRMISFSRVIYRHGDLAYYQFQTDLMNEARLISALGPVRAWLSSEIGKQGWESMRPNFTDEYVDYIERMMSEIEPENQFWK